MKVRFHVVLLALLSLNLLAASQSFAAKKKSESPPADAAPAAGTAAPAAGAPASNPEEGESVDVSKITEKYWAQGKETELGVVQNRKYTSAGRFELEGFFGTLSTDPFLSVHHYGLSLGYHFNQYFSLHGMFWRSVATPSDALKTFEAQTISTGTPSTVDTNMPQMFYGLQANYNFLYGKASLFGAMIIYVDLFALGGMGFTQTETGTNVTPFIGIGQKIHLNKSMALTLDYRIMRYNESIKHKSGSSLGQVYAERANTTDAITLGLSFFY